MANSNAAAEFIADLVAEIEAGLYDSHLRGIARACYKRRGTLEDGVGVVEDKFVPVIVEHDAPTEEVEDRQDEDFGRLLSAYEVFERGTKAEAIPVQKGQRVRDNAFRWNGVRYWRGYIDGRLFYFDNDVKPARYRKMCVRVEEVFIEGTSKTRLKIMACDSDPQQVGNEIQISRNLFMKRLLGLI